MIPVLQPPDALPLRAAQGWVELGNPAEARLELDHIAPGLRAHPDVLKVRWAICAAAREWPQALEVAQAITGLVPHDPFGFVHTAYVLHELKRTKEATDLLLPVVDRFPNEFIIRYNLACYACQLGDLKQAWEWLTKAVKLVGAANVKKMALNDADLEPLWNQVRSL